jgi:hypothetical protein
MKYLLYKIKKYCFFFENIKINFLINFNLIYNTILIYTNNIMNKSIKDSFNVSNLYYKYLQTIKTKINDSNIDVCDNFFSFCSSR